MAVLAGHGRERGGQPSRRQKTACRAEPHPAHLPGLPHLDEIELHYARLAVDGAVPVLGICRGVQVLNVAFGGTLLGDLQEFPEGGADHPGAKWDEWRALVATRWKSACRSAFSCS